MEIHSNRLFSKAIPTTRIGKLFQFPLFRIVIVFLFFIPFLLLSNLLSMHVIDKISEPYMTLLNYLRDIVTVLILINIYRIYTRRIERREAVEVNVHRSLKELGSGIFMSLVIVGFTVTLMSTLGYYKIGHFNSGMILLNRFFHYGIASLVEEFMFRLILFKLTEELCGSWIAMIITGFGFGFAHITNPSGSFGTSMSLVVSDTILMASAFMLTRRLWFVWGIHFSFNFFQNAVFGLPNSGMAYIGWITPVITGPGWMTGGAFGIEASVIQILISLGVGVFLLWKVYKKGQLVEPIWKRKKHT